MLSGCALAPYAFTPIRLHSAFCLGFTSPHLTFLVSFCCSSSLLFCFCFIFVLFFLVFLFFFFFKFTLKCLFHNIEDIRNYNTYTSFISILVPVSSVTLFPGGSALSVVDQTTMLLQCETSPGFPVPTVIWVTQQPTEDPVEITSGVSISYRNKTALTAVTSTLEYTVTRCDHGKLIFCLASNIIRETVTSAKLAFDVLC